MYRGISRGCSEGRQRKKKPAKGEDTNGRLDVVNKAKGGKKGPEGLSHVRNLWVYITVRGRD